MSLEDFTTYTKVDPNNRYTVAANLITVNNLSRDEIAYIVSDKGVDFFDGDYEHLLQFRTASSSSILSTLNPWTLANELGDIRNLLNLSPKLGAHTIQLLEIAATVNCILTESVAGGSSFNDQFSGTVNVIYYVKIIRDEAIGSFGQLQCFIYTDSDRTVLVDTLTIALHEKMDFRYVYAANSFNFAESKAFDGTINDLDLGLEEEEVIVLLRKGLGRGSNKGLMRGF